MELKMSSEFIAAISAISGMFIGALFSYLTMRIQLRRTIVSTSRQAWINTLRDAIAELQTKSMIIFEEYRSADHKDMIDAGRGIYLFINKIQLLLNPTEKDHVELIALLKLLYHATLYENIANDKEYDAIQSNITEKSQAILKREWIRVKNGK
jgi:hypothetical protein